MASIVRMQGVKLATGGGALNCFLGVDVPIPERIISSVTRRILTGGLVNKLPESMSMYGSWAVGRKGFLSVSRGESKPIA